jgi:isoquinoline 1-oxidoreductase subunit beta
MSTLFSGINNRCTYHCVGSDFGESRREVTVSGDNFRIDRVVTAVDCGQIVNPGSVRSQTEGAVISGLSAALKNEITIKNGVVERTNFEVERRFFVRAFRRTW